MNCKAIHATGLVVRAQPGGVRSSLSREEPELLFGVL